MVKAFLTASSAVHQSTEDFVRDLTQGEGFKGVGGFSLVCGNIGEPLAVVSNRTPDVDGVPWIAGKRDETAGLSNAAYGDRSWPKVVHGEKLLEKALSDSVESKDSKDQLIAKLFQLLSTDTLPKRKGNQSWESYVRELRNSIFIPVIGGEGMDGMSADTVAAANSDNKADVVDQPHQKEGNTGLFGTQKQTIVLVDYEGLVTYVERTLYGDRGCPIPVGTGDRIFEFQLPVLDSHSTDRRAISVSSVRYKYTN